MRQAFRASVLHCLADPGEASDSAALQFFDDGLLIIENGLVVEAGDAATLLPQIKNNIAITEFPGKIIVPGFIDCHVHFPQLDIIASYGAKLLDWLNRYAFPPKPALLMKIMHARSRRFSSMSC